MTEIPNDVSKLVSSSGNNFHARVARWLSEHGWHVIVSPYYMDQTQNKAREIDLVAEKLCEIKWDKHPDITGYVAVRLFVECKFIPTSSVFWFAEKDQESALKLVNNTNPFGKSRLEAKEHHYLANQSKVAKLFATSSGKAPENDPFYKALNQVLNAMTSMSGQTISVPKKEPHAPLKTVLEFPVIVCNSFGNMYSVDFYTDSQPELIGDNFLLEVRYAYTDKSNKQQNDYFLLDLVEFSQLEKFDQAINRNAKVAVGLLKELP